MDPAEGGAEVRPRRRAQLHNEFVSIYLMGMMAALIRQMNPESWAEGEVYAGAYFDAFVEGAIDRVMAVKG